MFMDELKLFTAAFVVLPAVHRNMEWNVNHLLPMVNHLLPGEPSAPDMNMWKDVTVQKPETTSYAHLKQTNENNF